MQKTTEGGKKERPFFRLFLFLPPRAWRHNTRTHRSLPKFLWRSLVSTPDVKFMVLGVKRFYEIIIVVCGGAGRMFRHMRIYIYTYIM